MNDGFIYPLVNNVIKILKYLNLVEYFKKVATSICLYNYRETGSPTSNEIKKYCNFAIDFYQIFKWATLFWLWFYIDEYVEIELHTISLKIDTSYFAWYLIVTNLFTYFYYHVWGSPHLQLLTRVTMNRRFMNTILAIAYYITAYAYLYEVHFAAYFSWPNNIVSHINALYLSVSNALTFSHDGFDAINNRGRFILISQAVNTFIFLTIIISNSIPNHFKEETR